MKCKNCGNELGVISDEMTCNKCNSVISRCEECSGEGGVITEFGSEECTRCNGEGFTITKRHNDISKKNLTIKLFYPGKTIDITNVSNMHKAWHFIKEFYSEEKNIMSKVEVYDSKGILINDICGHKTKNGRLWMVDSLKKKSKIKSSI